MTSRRTSRAPPTFSPGPPQLSVPSPPAGLPVYGPAAQWGSTWGAQQGSPWLQSGGEQELRIVMVGKTGAGKSATGNTILGRKCFESVASPTSMTEECSKGRGTVGGQRVVVVDTPGLFDTRCAREKTCRDIGDCILLAAPGPHVFLIVLKLDRLTEEERRAVQTIQEMFGQAADAYSMVLFTRGDDLQGAPIEGFVNQSPELLRLLQRCNHRYHVFNNRQSDGPQVEQLLRKVRQMVAENGGSHYTNQMFQEAEQQILAKQQSLLEERAQEIQREKERVAAEVAAEFEEKFRALSDKMEANRRREKEAMKQERQQMVAQLQQQGQHFIEEKLQKALDQQRAQLVRAQENQGRGPTHGDLQVYSQQMALMCSQLQTRLQLSEERQQVALQRQRVEMEREQNQREEARRQAERLQWEQQQRELQAQLEKERRRRQQEVEDHHRQEARKQAESSSSLGSWISDKVSSAWKGFKGLFGF